MRRDMDLIRRLLEYAEAKESIEPIPAPEIGGYYDDQIHYHLRLCQEAGYLRVEAMETRGVGAPRRAVHYRIIELTWRGHEQLAAMRGA